MIIDSKGIKVLVFSDVHQDIKRAKKIIASEGADINICLGDFFDSFVHRDRLDILDTCSFYDSFVNDPKNITLWGNHDTSYLSRNNNYALCSGYNRLAQEIIDRKISHGTVAKVKWHCFLDDFLLTHAGLSSHFFPFNAEISKEWVDNWLSNQTVEADNALFSQQSHWFFRAGMARGGNQIVGGLNWLDFNDEFVDVEGLPQIVGHTYQRIGKIRAVGKSFCIDTQLNQWITITNKKLEIKSFKDL